MPQLRLPDPVTLRRTTETLLIGGAGGLTLQLAGVPAGLVSGSVVAVAAAAITGRSLLIPTPLARLVFVLVGMALGSIVSPDTLRGLSAYPASLSVLAVSTAAMLAATTLYLRKVHRWDKLSALFAATPGALAQVMALSAESGGDLRPIVIVQTKRVVMLTVGIPLGLAAFGVANLPPGAGLVRPVASLLDLAILVPASVVPAFVLFRLRFGGGWLFGAMLGSGLLHGSGIVHGTLPAWVYGGAMVTLGAITGARFSSTSPRLLMSYVSAGLGSFAVAMTVAAASMLVVAKIVPVHPTDLVIAFAPGAQDTMMVLALALHLDPVFVAAHQIARYLLVATSIPFLAGWVGQPQDK